MNIHDQRFLGIIRCPKCVNFDLDFSSKKFIICTRCKSEFPFMNGSLYITNPELFEQQKKYILESQLPINRFKDFIKNIPYLFQFLTYAIGSISYFSGSPRRIIKKIYKNEDLKSKIVIYVGSGIKQIHPEIINLDIFPLKGVNFVTDATKLPIKDASVDMIITESTIEHIPNSELALEEIKRVIKPGGFVYISIPFLMPFHGSPNDYFRLTNEGIKQRFSNFKIIKMGMRGGPVSALVTFLMHFFALPFSAFSPAMYNFATYAIMLVLSPLRIFDAIFYLFPNSIEAAAMIYMVGKKQTD